MKHVAPIIFLICAIFLSSIADADQAILAQKASSFLDSIGVQIHITYKDGAYANVKNVLSDLNFLGIKYVRDGVPWHWGPDTSAVSDYVTLARGGVNFDLIVNSGIQIPAGQDFVTQNINVFKTIISAISPARLSAIEGPNEVDNWPVTYKGATAPDAALALQRDLYTAAKDLYPHGYPVYNLTGIATPSLSHLADYANGHIYPQNGSQPGYWMPGSLPKNDAVAGAFYPMVITEFGYSSLPQSGWYQIGVDEVTQAKGLLNGIFDAFNRNISRTYIYELLDEKPDLANSQREMHFGLFRNDHTAKPAAIAVRNLVTILSNRGQCTDQISKSLSFTFDGLPSTAKHLLLQKDDGAFEVILWNEVPIWDRENGVPINSAPIAITLELGGSSSVRIYDPLVGSDPIHLEAGVQHLQLNLPDHPIIAEIQRLDH